ncbi:immunity repressor [Mycobacterium phage Gail]|uniref:Immunity repressor n=1 Tax=Mycobacterium phage Gail TaxID=2743994 RepID=A0A7D5FUT1_9CAUD|nr:transcriptional repressor [Mycobacterium phage Gail]QLF84641.1 immunity repressor [Mycobacterium phage Gail]
MSGKIKRPTGRQPLIPSVIEDLKRKGYNQSQIAGMHGVTRQAVSDMKIRYGGSVTLRQSVNEAWPWETSNLHGKSSAYQRLRDHGEFMVTDGKGMSDSKIDKLKRWWKFLRDNDLVLEFDPNIDPYPGQKYGGFRYVPRVLEDEELLIRVNEHTKMTPKGEVIWSWPTDIETLLD